MNPLIRILSAPFFALLLPLLFQIRVRESKVQTLRVIDTPD